MYTYLPSTQDHPIVAMAVGHTAVAESSVYFLEIKGQQFFLLVDSYSKWLEVVPMDSTTTQATISVLNTIF